MSAKVTCPRRMSDWGHWEREEGLDTWKGKGGLVGQRGPRCSFCGSMHPDLFMELLADGGELGPTDKNYKAYITSADGSNGGKFYYQHLSIEQRDEFIAMLNEGRMRVGYPGHLYVLPFFASRKPPPG